MSDGYGTLKGTEAFRLGLERPGLRWGGPGLSACLGANRTVGGRRYRRAMAYFALTLTHGPGWDAARPIREQPAWDQHAAFMDRLVEERFIVLGGPLGNGDRTLHLVSADGAGQIEARMAQDPWAAMRLLEIGSIEPWALWLDGRASRAGLEPRAGPGHFSADLNVSPR